MAIIDSVRDALLGLLKNGANSTHWVWRRQCSRGVLPLELYCTDDADGLEECEHVAPVPFRLCVTSSYLVPPTVEEVRQGKSRSYSFADIKLQVQPHEFAQLRS